MAMPIAETPTIAELIVTAFGLGKKQSFIDRDEFAGGPDKLIRR